jgi:hypothetical protein
MFRENEELFSKRLILVESELYLLPSDAII